MITGFDWEGIWSVSHDPVIEHTLVIAELHCEPYSSLRGVADVIQEKKHALANNENISINLLDSSLSEDALLELNSLPRMHSVSIENVDFLGSRGTDRVCRSKLLQRRLSLEHRANILRFDVSEDCFCGDNDCDGTSPMLGTGDKKTWTDDKVSEMIGFLSGVTTLYITFKSAPAASLGPILASALAVNSTLIAIDCSRCDHNEAAITPDGVAMIVDSLEKNVHSRLALLYLYDNMNGPHISDELQTRLFRVLSRNAYLLANPFLSTCRINHNSDVLGTEGFEDRSAVAMVQECLAEHLDDEFVLAL